MKNAIRNRPVTPGAFSILVWILLNHTFCLFLFSTQEQARYWKKRESKLQQTEQEPVLQVKVQDSKPSFQEIFAQEEI